MKYLSLTRFAPPFPSHMYTFNGGEYAPVLRSARDADRIDYRAMLARVKHVPARDRSAVVHAEVFTGMTFREYVERVRS